MIVDAGPLLALFNPADRDHQRCVAFLRSNQLALVTTWPVLTEVMHLLRYSVDAQLRLLSWIDRGGLALAELQQGSIGAVGRLIDKYRDRPMDLADASVVQLAVQTGCPGCRRMRKFIMSLSAPIAAPRSASLRL